VLYQFTLDTIKEQNCRLIYANEDIYASELVFPELEYKTYYEKLHLEKNKKIKYIRFQLGY
jgi:tRNA (guanine-N7-)-methyltransferase